MVSDCDRLNYARRFGPREVNGQQSVLQVGTQYLHTVCQHESALELTGRNPAMEIVSGLLVILSAANQELAFLDRYVQFVTGETRDRQGDAQPLRPAIVQRDPLYVVGWVSVGRLCDSI